MFSKNTPSSCTAEHLDDFTFMLQLSPVNLEAGSQADIGRSCISSAFAIFPHIPIHQPAKSWTCAMEKVWSSKKKTDTSSISIFQYFTIWEVVWVWNLTASGIPAARKAEPQSQGRVQGGGSSSSELASGIEANNAERVEAFKWKTFQSSTFAKMVVK